LLCQRCNVGDSRTTSTEWPFDRQSEVRSG
jgi:hypothetical protein